MKICKKCGAQLEDTAQFCAACGEKSEVTESVNTDLPTAKKAGNGKFIAIIACLAAALVVAIVVVVVVLCHSNKEKAANGKSPESSAVVVGEEADVVTTSSTPVNNTETEEKAYLCSTTEKAIELLQEVQAGNVNNIEYLNPPKYWEEKAKEKGMSTAEYIEYAKKVYSAYWNAEYKGYYIGTTCNGIVKHPDKRQIIEAVKSQWNMEATDVKSIEIETCWDEGYMDVDSVDLTAVKIDDNWYLCMLVEDELQYCLEIDQLEGYLKD